MENQKINVEGETKKPSRKTIVLDVIIAIVAVLFCAFGLPWFAWAFDCWAFIWGVQVAIAGIFGLIAFAAFVMLFDKKNRTLRSRFFPFPLFNFFAILIICVVNIIVVSSKPYGSSLRSWGNCVANSWYLYSKFGVEKVFNRGRDGLWGIYRVYDEDWEKCFLAVDVEKETKKEDRWDDYDERKEITLSAKIYDKNGNYLGGLSPYYGTVYKLSRTEYYEYDNDDKFRKVSDALKVILVEYLDREKFYLAEDYKGYPVQVRPAQKKEEPKQQSTSYSINVSANPNNGGGVTGGGTYDKGKSCTVTASANSGYSFTNWTENGNEVSTNASYAFTVSNNRSLVANFKSKSSPQPPEPIRQPQPFQVWQECFMCGGSGQCRYCYGYGWAANGKDACGICHGTGKCSQCAGHGGKNVIEYH